MIVLNSLEIVKASKALNAKIFSLPRLQLLSALYLLGDEYALYRDLKASLAMDDGVLISNLNALRKMEYLKKNEVQVENKKMDAYKITENGKDAFNKVNAWLAQFTKENSGGSNGGKD